MFRRRKKSIIICRYCSQSFTRRNCHQNHLIKYKDIIYEEENQLEILLRENAISTDIRSAKEQIPPLAIFYNETNEANEATETDKANKSTEANEANEANEITIEYTQQG
ncbi:14829_t:CDS:2 [Dentiscutata erythropus]|uniref:14829_t:CDS:1 n=1 Tax=Dentiscutata erythropus TaxID=1348616 RepID=A0A9N9CIR4_9GLOM|nr:14829_t:CDS:2 [Dentiscutata erythropus]